MVIHLHQCTECATLTEDGPNSYGNYYCNRHKPTFAYGTPVTASMDLVELAA
jgi:hypothetical protein